MEHGWVCVGALRKVILSLPPPPSPLSHTLLPPELSAWAALLPSAAVGAEFEGFSSKDFHFSR
jgi:hypothetical protein